MRLPSDDDSVWYALFKAALAGSSALNVNPAEVAERAAQIATESQSIMAARFGSGEDTDIGDAYGS